MPNLTDDTDYPLDAALTGAEKVVFVEGTDIKKATLSDVRSFALTGTYVDGIVTDGVTDNKAALDAAIAAADDGEILRLPSGQIAFSNLAAAPLNRSVTLQGDGWSTLVTDSFGNANWGLAADAVKGTVLRCLSTSGDALALSQTSKLHLRKLALVGPGSGTGRGVDGGGALSPCVGVVWDDVLIANFATGMISNFNEAQISQLHIRGCQTGLTHTGASNNNHWDMLAIQATSTYGINHAGGSGNVYTAPLFQANTGTSLRIEGLNTTGNHFISPWFENTAGTGAIELPGTAGSSSGQYTRFDNLRIEGTTDTATIAADDVQIVGICGHKTINLAGSVRFLGVGNFVGFLTNVPADAVLVGAMTTSVPWVAPTFVNSWANASGLTAGYRKDASGYVHMTGKIGGGLANTTAFTLPVGYRPAQETDIPASRWNAGRDLSHVRVNADGTVVISAAGDWTDLSSVVFLAEA